jgi:phosphoribosylformylglycinamidine synthase
MAGKGEVGIQMHTDRVPQREAGMTPYEIMLSESQERMLVIVEPQDFPKVEAIFHKWDLEAVVVGEVIEEQVLRIVHDGVVEAEIPPEYLILGGKAPVYTRETKEPEYFQRLKNAELPKADSSLDPGKELLAMLAHENLCSRAKVYQQYDHMVQISTVVEPGSDAAVVAIKGTDKAIALCTDCNSRYCYLDPYEGTRAAVAESALNVAVSGAKPLAISNCLNFGNPYKPEIYWGFSQAIKGMGDACRALDTPVTGGNVSLYNENPESAVYPTPVIGMLGLLEDMKLALTQFFKSEGDQIMLIGNLPEDLGASQYLEFRHNMVAGRVPKLDIDAHKRLIDLLQELSSQKLLKSAHDVADGGLGVALAECLFDNTDLGAKVTLPQADNPILSLFGEVQSTVIISFKPSNLETVKKLVQQSGLQHWMLGEVTSNGTLKIESILELSTQELYDTWRDALQLK